MSDADPTPDEAFERLLERYQRAVDAEQLDDAATAAEAIFEHAAEHCAANPTPAFNLTIAASQCEEVGDWGGAEAAYQQILSLPDHEPQVERSAHAQLARLYQLLSREAEALDHARRCTAAARRTDIEVSVSMARRIEAEVLLHFGHTQAARTAIAEAVSVLDDDKKFDHLRASAVTMRAECAVADGLLNDAARDLEQAYAALEPLGKMWHAAGVHGDLAQWWATTAKLRRGRDDLAGATAAWEEALAVSRRVDDLPHASSVHTKAKVAEMLQGLAESLSRSGRRDGATAALKERRELLSRIGLPAQDVG